MKAGGGVSVVLINGKCFPSSYLPATLLKSSLTFN